MNNEWISVLHSMPPRMTMVTVYSPQGKCIVRAWHNLDDEEISDINCQMMGWIKHEDEESDSIIVTHYHLGNPTEPPSQQQIDAVLDKSNLIEQYLDEDYKIAEAIAKVTGGELI